MSELEAIRDQLKAVLANHDSLTANVNAVRDQATSALAAVEAELTRKPGVDDIRALLDRMK